MLPLTAAESGEHKLELISLDNVTEANAAAVGVLEDAFVDASEFGVPPVAEHPMKLGKGEIVAERSDDPASVCCLVHNGKRTNIGLGDAMFFSTLLTFHPGMRLPFFESLMTASFSALQLDDEELHELNAPGVSHVARLIGERAHFPRL